VISYSRIKQDFYWGYNSRFFSAFGILFVGLVVLLLINGFPIVDQDSARYHAWNIIPGAKSPLTLHVPIHGAVMPQLLNWVPSVWGGVWGIALLNILVVSYCFGRLFSATIEKINVGQPRVALGLMICGFFIASFAPFLAISILSEGLTMSVFALVWAILIKNRFSLLDISFLLLFGGYHSSNAPVVFAALGGFLLFDLFRRQKYFLIPLLLVIIWASVKIDRKLFEYANPNSVRLESSFLGAILINYYGFVYDAACADLPTIKICSPRLRNFIAQNRTPQIYQPGQFLWGQTRIVNSYNHGEAKLTSEEMVSVSEFETFSKYLLFKALTLVPRDLFLFLEVSISRISALFWQSKLVLENSYVVSRYGEGLITSLCYAGVCSSSPIHTLSNLVKLQALWLLPLLLGFAYFKRRDQLSANGRWIVMGLVLYLANLVLLGLTATAVSRYHYRTFFILTTLEVFLLYSLFWENLHSCCRLLARLYFSVFKLFESGLSLLRPHLSRLNTSKVIFFLMVFFLVYVAWQLRISGIEDLYWSSDDLDHLRIATQPTWLELFRESYADAHPPLRNIILALITSFSPWPISTKMLALVPGALVCGMLALVLARLGSSNFASLCFSAILVFSPFMVSLSQGTRPYMLLAFFIILQLYSFICSVRSGSAVAVVAYTLFSTLALFTDYSCAPVICATFVIAAGTFLIKRGPSFIAALSFWLYSHSAILIFMLFQVLLFLAVGKYHFSTTTYLHDGFALSVFETFRNIWSLLIKFLPRLSYFSSLWGVFIAGLIISLVVSRKWMYLFLALLPFGCAVLFSEVGVFPLKPARQSIILMFPLIFALAGAVDGLSTRNIRALLCMSLLLFTLALDGAKDFKKQVAVFESGHASPSMQDYRDARQYLIKRLRRGDVVVNNIPQPLYVHMSKLDPFDPLVQAYNYLKNKTEPVDYVRLLSLPIPGPRIDGGRRCCVNCYIKGIERQLPPVLFEQSLRVKWNFFTFCQ
jgi:hypothetical protein